MTARGAVLAMFALFFAGLLVAGWLHLGVLTGLAFVAGCVLAARYTKRDGLLAAVVAPPLAFMIALTIVEMLSSHGSTRHTLTSAAEGIVLTLASVAPWLFAGVILGIIVALFRGLPQAVRDLRAELRGDPGPRPPAGARPATGSASDRRLPGAATRAEARTPSAPAPPRPQ